MNELIDRLAAKEKAEIRAMAQVSRRSIGQRFRWNKARLAKLVTNGRKPK